MADLTLNEWDGLLELVEIDLTSWGEGTLYFCNSAKGWQPIELEDGQTIYEVTDTLAVELVPFGDNDYVVVPFRTSGWMRGEDSSVRPSVELADIGGSLLRFFRSLNGAPLAPVRQMYVLAADLDANNGIVVGVPQEFLINKVTGNGMLLNIELATHSDATRTPFPPSTYDEQRYPGLRNRYTRA